MIKLKICLLLFLCNSYVNGFYGPIGSQKAGGTMPLDLNGKMLTSRFEVRRQGQVSKQKNSNKNSNKKKAMRSFVQAVAKNGKKAHKKLIQRNPAFEQRGGVAPYPVLPTLLDSFALLMLTKALQITIPGTSLR